MNEILIECRKSLGVNEFLNLSKEYVLDNFPSLNLNDFFENTISGKINFDSFKIDFFSSIRQDFLEIIKVIISILIVIIIHSIFKIVVQSLKNSTSSKIAEIIQYLIIVGMVSNLFCLIINEFKYLLDRIVLFMNMFIPFLASIIVLTGNIITSSVVQNILFFSIIFISNFIQKFIIPLFLITTTLSIVSNFSNKIRIEKLSKFLKSSIIWIVGIILTIFISILSLETEISGSVDELTTKVSKVAITNFIPVVGKIMGDSIEAVLGSINIIKNSVGIIGIVVVISITIFPIIKLFIMYLLFYLVAGFSELIAEENIVKLIENLADNLKLLLGIFISVTIMLIIEIVIVIKITSGLVM